MEPRVDDRVRDWVAEQLATDVTIVPYPGGLTGTAFRVTTGDGYACALRSLPPADWGSEAARHIDSERLGVTLLRGSTVPVPRLLAVDPDGSASGAPSSLTTELPGRMDLHPTPASVAALAATAVAIHRTPVSGRRPHPYRLWTQGRVTVPAFARDARLWRRAIAVLEAGPPRTPPVLIHRDFHPGNVVWTDGAISGVIDWAETAWGPADLDVAHCATNLALLGGVECATAFRAAYVAAGGVLEAGPARAFWPLADLVGFLPDPVAHVTAMRRVRTDLDPVTVRTRLDDLVGVTLDG